ncbi:unnamed protein product [Caenorhabditis auriculariae]|uniref:Fizzy-related protein homolog n=1 Tax=Caenorhabditis auriculariae TaxID=2777116 RepID=A0A8S1HDU8_9PELO|nr:unnamed protein product [Caenorhabditis auriculariae]
MLENASVMEEDLQPVLPVRRMLSEHNPGTSPVKAPNLSPRVTPTKGANPYGDRFIPLRQPHSELNARFCAIYNTDHDAVHTFKRPMGNSTRMNAGGGTGNSGGGGGGGDSHPTSHGSNSSSHQFSASSGTSSPSGYQVQQMCIEEHRRDEIVLRALLRNEMLKDRIDDLHSYPPEDNYHSSSSMSMSSNAPSSNSHRQQHHHHHHHPHPPQQHPQHQAQSTPQHPPPAQSVSPPEAFSSAAAAVIPTSAVASATVTVTAPDTVVVPHVTPSANQTTPQRSSASLPTSSCHEGTRISSSAKNLTTIHSSPSRNLFSYSAKTTPNKYGPPSTSVNVSPFSGPLSEDSQRLLKTPRKPQRKVPKNPYKVLDAPELQDDFYLNLVDWSAQNMLSVGLSSCVYLWSAHNSQVIKLCDLQNEQDTVTSVQWADKGDLLAVGTNRGITQIWDVAAQKKVRDLVGHQSRIGCLAWNADTICSGSRDRTIMHRDIRVDDRETPRKLTTHRQEVCGLKWSPDKQLLASGGNDNQLLVWNMRRNDPVQTYTDHNAAVKALAWSPHHHGLLVSGGGTADRCLRFWNTLTAQPMQYIDTGSQVCNVAWSKHSSELVSTHGYSYNHVIIWKYPSLQPVTKLVGHQYRVLYLAMSPDGESIVTGAGDETLRFWHVFNKTGAPRASRSKLNLFTSLR